MTKAAPFVCPPPEANGPYKYFKIGSVNPVRVTCDDRGRHIGAESPDQENGGALKIAHTLLGTIGKDEDVDEITKQEFVEMCQDARIRFRQP